MCSGAEARQRKKFRRGKILRPHFQIIQMKHQFQIIQMNTILVAARRRRP